MARNSQISILKRCVIGFTAVALIALWGLAFALTYQEHQRELQERAIVHPGKVSYGTHSTAFVPFSSRPFRRSGVPMISGNDVRRHARSGHAAMHVATSNNNLYASSSAQVTSAGSLGAIGPINNTSATSAPSRGIIYTTLNLSMPVLAWNATAPMLSHRDMGKAAIETSTHRVKPGYAGEDGDWINGGSGDWWYYDEDHWRNPYDGETRFDPTLGYVVVWNGAEWIKLTEYDPGLPIGDAPWLWMLLLAVAYILTCRVLRIRKCRA